MVSYKGPLPPPAELERYESVVPGLAKQLAEAMLKEQEHRHALDRQVLELERSDSSRAHRVAWGALVPAMLFAIATIIGTVTGYTDGALYGAASAAIYVVCNTVVALVRNRTLSAGQSDDQNS